MLGILPFELLSRITTECSRAAADAPYILSRISKEFQVIAFSTPSAWRRLTIKVSDASQEQAAGKLNFWFRHSRPYTIAVCVDLETSQSPTVVNILRQNVQRILALDVQGCENTAPLFVNSVLTDSVTIASQSLSLSICVFSDWPPEGFHPLPHKFPSNSKSLQLSNCAPIPSLIHPSLFKNLHTLLIHLPLRKALHIEALCQVWQISRSLVEADIRARIQVADASRLPVPICLPTLERLFLRANHIPALLNTVDAPALQTMRIVDLDGARLGGVGELGSAARRILEKLEHTLSCLSVCGLSMRRNGSDSSDDLDWCFQRSQTGRIFYRER